MPSAERRMKNAQECTF